MTDNRFKVNIDGILIDCDPNETILQAANRIGVYIPTMCHDDRLKPSGRCRLCIVQVHGEPGPVAACTTPVANNMVITTENESIRKTRKKLIEIMLSKHPNDCMRCEAAGDCTLQDLSYRYSIDCKGIAEELRQPIRDDHPFITFEPDKCVRCGRCLRICNEVVTANAIEVDKRGAKSIPELAFKSPGAIENCEYCGQCVSTCPTGALTDKKARGKGRSYEMKKVRTTCGYCGTGCNFDLNVRDGKVIKVTSAYDAPVNQGNLCIKGRYGYDFIHSKDRITTPLIKKKGKFVEATWDEALDLVAHTFKKLIKEHGTDAVGGYSSARCTNEENFLLAKFVRTVFRSNNVDNCARV